MRVFASIFFVIFLSIKSFAWNDHAHMLAAAIAWDRFDDAQKKKVTNILEHHPEYSNAWKKAYYPYKDLMPMGKFLMMNASVWPDEIKKKDNINFSYHRPTWHYIVQQLRFDEQINESNPVVKLEKDSSNIITALDFTYSNCSNQTVSKTLRAVYFSWFIHLVADIHQPLHTCALYDSVDLKKSDRGGNDIYIRTATDTTSLQDVWDNILGSSIDLKLILQEGFIARKEMPYEDIHTEEKQPENWAKASFLIAKNQVYQNGKLQFSYKRKPELPLLPEGYETNAKNIAKQQITLAGYRLADKMIELLK